MIFLLVSSSTACISLHRFVVVSVDVLPKVVPSLVATVVLSDVDERIGADEVDGSVALVFTVEPVLTTVFSALGEVVEVLIVTVVSTI